MEIICALSLFFCCMFSLVFIVQIFGGFLGVFFDRFKGYSSFWGLSLVFAVIFGSLFFWSAKENFEQGHSSNNNKQVVPQQP